MTLRIIFLGTPEFALPSFKALLADPEIKVLGAVTQPDRPSGRGQKLTPPPVKVHAAMVGLPVWQPVKIRKDLQVLDWLRAEAPDYLVTAAFGQILSQEVLDIPKYGTVNVHASLLPQYRGPNPVQWAILNGDMVTGISTMFTELAVDAGPVLLQAQTSIDPLEDTVTLTARLAELGASILPRSLHDYAAGSLVATPQDVAMVTHAPKREKRDAWVDWTQSAEALHNRIRAQRHWPGNITEIDGQTVKLVQTLPPSQWVGAAAVVKHGKPGEILAVIAEGLVIQTGDGPILLTQIQPPGKPKMLATDWSRGAFKDPVQKRFLTPAVLPL